jgi:ABC-type transport system involved in multi-copper enzyme maturation permease subunit
MTLLTAPPAATGTDPNDAADDLSGARVTGLRVLRSEWGKFWSLRSSRATLGIGAVVLVAFGMIASSSFHPATAGTGHLFGSASDGVGLALSGLTPTMLAIGVLGVLVSAGEYSTGMIRSTLAAVPKRLPVLWSKAAVYGVVAFAATTVAALLAFLLGGTALAGTSAAVSLTAHGVLRCLVGAGLYLALVGVLGVGLGALLRSVAGGITALIGGMMILPGLVSLLPSSIAGHISPYLPSNAADAVTTLHHTAGLLSPGAGLAVLAGWTALVLGGAAFRLTRTDV